MFVWTHMFNIMCVEVIGCCSQSAVPYQSHLHPFSLMRPSSITKQKRSMSNSMSMSY